MTHSEPKASDPRCAQHRPVRGTSAPSQNVHCQQSWQGSGRPALGCHCKSRQPSHIAPWRRHTRDAPTPEPQGCPPAVAQRPHSANPQHPSQSLVLQCRAFNAVAQAAKQLVQHANVYLQRNAVWVLAAFFQPLDSLSRDRVTHRAKRPCRASFPWRRLCGCRCTWWGAAMPHLCCASLSLPDCCPLLLPAACCLGVDHQATL
jgi:hypothetical protein